MGDINEMESDITGADIYRWPNQVLKDESTEEYEYFEYPPHSETEQTLNNVGEIHFTIDSQSRSYLYFKGKLVKTNGAMYEISDNITLVNNGLMYLFSQIRYSLSGQTIEDDLNPGQSTTLLGMLRYPDDFSKSSGLIQCWYKDDNKGDAVSTGEEENSGFKTRKKLSIDSIAEDGEKGSFSFCISLSHIFGFCEDYDKVIYGLTHTLSLYRKGDGEAILKGQKTNNAATAVAEG